MYFTIDNFHVRVMFVAFILQMIYIDSERNRNYNVEKDRIKKLTEESFK